MKIIVNIKTDIYIHLIYFLKMSIVSSKEQTADWRKNQNWYHGGKQNQCEKYQKKSSIKNN